VYPEPQALERRLAADRAVDRVLADSFPASDPPSWTMGIAHPQAEPSDTNTETVVPDSRDSRLKDAEIDSRPKDLDANSPLKRGAFEAPRPAWDGRTFLRGMGSLAGAIGLALLAPFVILLIGLPIALAARGLSAAGGWLIGRIFG
jgi:hypothetical protein